MLPVWVPNAHSSTSSRLRRGTLLLIVAAAAGLTFIWHWDTRTAQARWPAHASAKSPEHTQGTRRILLKVGGVPSEGFGSSLNFLRHGMRLAHLLSVDFAAVRTFDFQDVYNVVDELNVGVDFTQYNWNNMCNLHTTIAINTEVWTPGDVLENRVAIMRQMVYQLNKESLQYAQHQPYNVTYIGTVKERLKSCDVILLAEQNVLFDDVWDDITREWTKKAVEKNVRAKVTSGAIKPAVPQDLHIHYRWSDVKSAITAGDAKWKFDNAALEKTIESVEVCLGRPLSTNIFMKRSKEQESVEELRKITYPLRQSAPIVEGHDDIADLYDLSRAKILALTAGTYSNTAAALGSPALVVHNGAAAHSYAFLEESGTMLLQQGEIIDHDRCSVLIAKL